MTSAGLRGPGPRFQRSIRGRAGLRFLGVVECFGECCQLRYADAERGRQACDASPARVLVATLELGDPRRMQISSVSQLLLRKPSRAAELSYGPAERRLGAARWRHPWTVPVK
jgi:hypothetical protein